MEFPPLYAGDSERYVRVMSVIPLKADIRQRSLHVRLVPEADCRPVHRFGYAVKT
jgi:hypothetical protein